MEAKAWNHMLATVGRVGQPSVSNTSLDTKLRCKGGLAFTPSVAACWQLIRNDSYALAERPASALLVADDAFTCGHLWNLR